MHEFHFNNDTKNMRLIATINLFKIIMFTGTMSSQTHVTLKVYMLR